MMMPKLLLIVAMTQESVFTSGGIDIELVNPHQEHELVCTLLCNEEADYGS